MNLSGCHGDCSLFSKSHMSKFDPVDTARPEAVHGCGPDRLLGPVWVEGLAALHHAAMIFASTCLPNLLAAGPVSWADTVVWHKRLFRGGFAIGDEYRGHGDVGEADLC